MQIFDRLGDEYEQVVVCHDPSVGLRAIVAIHSTVLGPALGGTRFYPYRSEDLAMEDVLRLARGMTYKSAVAGLNLGGGKAVIMGDPAADKSEGLLRAYGRFLDTLSGRYVTAEDVGTTQADMDVIFTATPNVTGISSALGGSGDPSTATAYGLWWAIKALRTALDATEDLTGVRVVVSGVGKVGSSLVDHLVADGAVVTIADINEAAVARVLATHRGSGGTTGSNGSGHRGSGPPTAVTAVPVSQAHRLECDVFSPCALGGVLNATTIPELNCRGVAGCANNQLATPADGTRLVKRGIMYAPDFVVNSGGVINIAQELAGYDQQKAYAKLKGIFDTTLRVLLVSQQHGVSANEVAEAMAEHRIAGARAVVGYQGTRRFDGTARRRAGTS